MKKPSKAVIKQATELAKQKNKPVLVGWHAMASMRNAADIFEYKGQGSRWLKKNLRDGYLVHPDGRVESVF